MHMKHRLGRTLAGTAIVLGSLGLAGSAAVFAGSSSAGASVAPIGFTVPVTGTPIVLPPTLVLDLQVGLSTILSPLNVVL